MLALKRAVVVSTFRTVYSARFHAKLYTSPTLLHHLKPLKIAHWFCTHMVIPFEQCSKLYYHLERSKQGLGNQHCTVISPFKTTIANGFKWCINLYEKGTKSRRVNSIILLHKSILYMRDPGYGILLIYILLNGIINPFC